MPLDSLHPRTALVVVDLQVGTVASLPSGADAIVAHATALAAAFRERGLPVVLATVDGTPAGRTTHGPGGRVFPPEWTTPVVGLEPRPGDIAVTRRTWSVLAGTGVAERLAEAGVGEIVVVGVATSFGVESTARQAYDSGLDVTVVSDAVGDRSEEAHAGSLARVLPALGRLATTAEVLAALPA